MVLSLFHFLSAVSPSALTRPSNCRWKIKNFVKWTNNCKRKTIPWNYWWKSMDCVRPPHPQSPSNHLDRTRFRHSMTAHQLDADEWEFVVIFIVYSFVVLFCREYFTFAVVAQLKFDLILMGARMRRPDKCASILYDSEMRQMRNGPQRMGNIYFFLLHWMRCNWNGNVIARHVKYLLKYWLIVEYGWCFMVVPGYGFTVFLSRMYRTLWTRDAHRPKS